MIAALKGWFLRTFSPRVYTREEYKDITHDIAEEMAARNTTYLHIDCVKERPPVIAAMRGGVRYYRVDGDSIEYLVNTVGEVRRSIEDLEKAVQDAYESRVETAREALKGKRRVRKIIRGTHERRQFTHV